MRVFRGVAALAILLAAGSAQAQDQKPAPPPYTKHAIYAENANPATDIAAALKKARAEHKRVILDFGGDWCGDCQVLDIYFHQDPNNALLTQNFVLVHVFVRETLDNNIAVATRYGIPLGKGVPALAVLDADGKVLYSQRTGQFNDMRHMDVASVTQFLTKWKG